MTDLGIRGMSELGRALDGFPRRLQRSLLRRALRQGANVILRDARQRVPVGRGGLRRSLKVRSARSGRDAVGMQVVAGNKAYYAHFVEFGTRKMPAQPFLRPALDHSSEAALQTVRATLAAGLQEGLPP